MNAGREVDKVELMKEKRVKNKTLRKRQKKRNEGKADPLLKLFDAALVDLLELLSQVEELAIEGAEEVIERENRLLHCLGNK